MDSRNALKTDPSAKETLVAQAMEYLHQHKGMSIQMMAALDEYIARLRSDGACMNRALIEMGAPYCAGCGDWHQGERCYG